MGRSVMPVTDEMPPLSHMAVSMQCASRSPVTPEPCNPTFEAPQALAALRQVLRDGPVLQELGAVMEDLAPRLSDLRHDHAGGDAVR